MFDARQRARFGGKPIRFFLVLRQGQSWRYCSADRDLTIGDATWLSAQIERSDIKLTPEPAKDKVTLRFAYLLAPDAGSYPVTQPLGDNWQPYVPTDEVRVICLEGHHGDDTPPVVQWMGVVTAVKCSDVEMELTCEPAANVGKSLNQGAKWQIGCWKTPYSTGIRGCNMLPDNFKVTGTVSAAVGQSITAPEFAASVYSLAGGYLTYEAASGLLVRRGIAAHALGSDTVTLTAGGPNPPVGAAVTALPTCPRTWAACLARNNTIHYGGAIYKPVKTPDGVSMSWG